MTEAQYNAKYKEMQKYVPFIQRVIENLRVNNEQHADNPRKAQLQKMEMLLDLLTNKAKMIKMETLVKCEGVLIKLQAKIEKNGDFILNDVKLKQQMPNNPTTSNNAKIQDTKKMSSTSRNTTALDAEDTSGPASPPPEVIADDIEQPVVIPTERRCSPILVKEAAKTVKDNTKQVTDSRKPKDSQHSTSEHFESLKRKVFPVDNKTGGSKHNSEGEKSPQQHHHHHHHHREHYGGSHAKEPQHSKLLGANTQNNSKTKEKSFPTKKPSAPIQKLQTVKVVITEPLPAHVKKQHFPTSCKYLPRSSVCHSNLKTLPQLSQTNNHEAYSPEELWDKYNESQTKRPINTTTLPPVFNRLGIKVSEISSSDCAAPSKPPGRYTPIPEVLKSPPLSATDINNLLLESGAEKLSNDISEIGSRRPTKTEDTSSKNSFEFVRKKLAQTVHMNNPINDNQKLQTEKVESNSSPLPHERLALKYNPHPRQERLQSMSSTDGSECSTQSKVNDPRIKLKLPTNNTLNSPTQIANINVNVLPAINLNDPRLKRQNTVPLLPTPTARKTLLSTPPTLTSTPIMSYPNTNPLSYSYRKDPRISRIPNQPLSSAQTPPPPPRKDSINQPQYSSEENWDSDEEEVSLPTRQLNRDHEPRVENRIENSKNINANQQPNRKNNMSHARFPLNSGSDKSATTEPEENWSTNTEKEVSKTYVQDRNKTNILNKERTTPTNTLSTPKKNKKKLKDDRNAFVWPAPPPKSESEEDWDSEPETVNVKLNVEPAAGSPKISPIEKPPVSPVVSPFPNHIASKPFAANTMLQIPATLPPIILPPNPYSQPPYPIIGPQNHTFPIQSSAPSNRFSSVLNDKSERIKYFEAKKQKSHEPRTYKEFREAKERAQAQEAALKRAAQEEEAKKRAVNHEKVTTATDTKEAQKDGQPQTVDETKNDKKPHQMETNKSMTQSHKDHKKSPAPLESSLDKMYRTQNFNSKLPKTNTSFRIPKKKTEEKLPEETATKTNEECKKSSENTNKDMPADNIKETNIKSPIETSVENQNPKDKGDNIKCTNNKNHTEPLVLKHLPTVNKNDKQEEKHENPENSEENKKMQKVASSHKEQAINEKTEDEDKDRDKSANNTLSKDNETEQNIPDQVNNKEILIEDNKIKNSRDPRCRSKDQTKVTEDEKILENKAQEEKFQMFGDIVITSSENEVTLKPQQNLTALDKFNKLTQEFAPKPQRILRRRNTMVVFDSAPLVDKEKLRKANALLFEDVQEEEKRKRKQLEEERLNARRNKNLEEMFKKTDDNCTVSTQNIITGKRRTRATINFNETVNAINVFKHKTIKDLNTTAPAQATTHPVKTTRSNAKLKMKNLEAQDTKDDDKSDDDNTETAANKDLNKVNKESKAVKTNPLKNENKTEEIDNTKLNVKTTKKRNAPNKKSCNSNVNSKDAQMTSSALTTNNEVGFIPIQEDEHQNCAVSSTSTEISSEHQSTSSTTTTNRSFKKETDDNEPTSTATKSNNSTPTPEANVQVLNEIVDQILKPNADRGHILGLLGQILSEERLEVIKSLIESSNTQNQEQPLTTDETTHNREVKQENNKSSNEVNEKEEEDGDEFEEQTTSKFKKATTGKKIVLTKRKQRSELDRLNEDIRDMFICKGVLTATGRRMCTIMGKEVEAETNKAKPTKKEINTSHANENPQNYKRKEEKLKPPVTTRPLRRSLRVCKTAEDNEDDDNHSILSRTTEESIDELNTNTDTSTSTDATPQRKMPVLKPHTPIKIPEEVATKSSKCKEPATKRKSGTKSAIKSKRLKSTKVNAKEDSESEEQASETEADEEESQNVKNVVKNTNLNWHNQSKFTTWCLICEKRLQTNSSSLHYKTHHGEN